MGAAAGLGQGIVGVIGAGAAQKRAKGDRRILMLI